MRQIVLKVLLKGTGIFVILLSRDGFKEIIQKKSSKQSLPKFILEK